MERTQPRNVPIVRANGGKGIPLVAGFNWAYDLTPPVKESLLEVDGIAYVSHPYPQKREIPSDLNRNGIFRSRRSWSTHSRQGKYFKKKLQSYKY